MRAIIAPLLGALLWSGIAGAAQTHWQAVAARVTEAVEAVRGAYEAGDGAAARKLLMDAYFGQFEDSKMEAAIRKQIGQSRAVALEGMFGDLRKAIKAGDGAMVAALTQRLGSALAEDGKLLDAAGVPAEVYEVNR